MKASKKTIRIETECEKSATFRCFEYVLLLVCLCVLGLRGTYTESPHIATIDAMQSLSNEGFSLIISSVLILAAASWFIASIWRGEFVYRVTWIEIGLLLFLVAGGIGIAVASDKRAAVTDIVTLGAAMLTGVMLVQILDSPGRIMLTLVVVVGIAGVNLYQCVDQSTSSNEMLIEQYEQDPDAQLEQLGIEKGSFQQYLYEHRLYSKDVRGYFKTSNSVGAFAILAVAAGLGLCFIKAGREEVSGGDQAARWVVGALSAMIVAGVVGLLLIAQSKGATGGAFVAMVMFGMYLVMPESLKQRKKLILFLCLTAAAAAGAVVVYYGVSHGRLPGGNSMLVRWQYWQAGWEMYADHPLTGVGGGNFGQYYTHYKIPAALETVKDPHNILLAFLTQYGPMGLVGFLGAVLVPMLMMVFKLSEEVLEGEEEAVQKNPRLWYYVGAGIAIAAVMLIFRPYLSPVETTSDSEVKFFAAVYFYIVPAMVFTVAVFLLGVCRSNSSAEGEMCSFQFSHASAAIFCGLAGVLVANLIDFAIFEPGVLTVFWVMLACMGAIAFGNRESVCLRIPAGVRVILTVLVAGFLFGFFHYAVNPAVRAGAKQQRAMKNLMDSHELLAEAARDDVLSAVALNLNGRAFVQHYKETGGYNEALLAEAVKCFIEATRRDEANFKNYEKLAEAYTLLAMASGQEAKEGLYREAYKYAFSAMERYPGSGRICFTAAELAEKLGEKDAAVVYYERAVRIEEEFREMFKVMYPGREVFSRLGHGKYEAAKVKIKQLRQ